ncbi:hypothetical protein EDD18DRAFT_1100578 [Armillaria luteobubalina]|uniref:Uncharacterized protein n=1 Tax=Armillaria luteobubalina TaxID=153913 RepID=A0AA39QI50_9AGAR|nr:hypothetical protein EDD18DRAFT_1100578 [Armillaria luteobubalina]
MFMVIKAYADVEKDTFLGFADPPKSITYFIQNMRAQNIQPNRDPIRLALASLSQSDKDEIIMTIWISGWSDVPEVRCLDPIVPFVQMSGLRIAQSTYTLTNQAPRFFLNMLKWFSFVSSSTVVGSAGRHGHLARPQRKRRSPNAAPQSRNRIIGPSTYVERRPDEVDEMAPVLLIPQSEVNTSRKKQRVLSKLLRPLSAAQAAITRALKKIAGVGIRCRVGAQK